MKRVLHSEVRRGHIVVAHRHKDLQIGVLGQRIAQGDARIHVAIVSVPIPGPDAAAENVVLKVGFVTEFSTNIAVESRSVGGTDRSFTCVKVRTISRKTGIKSLETAVEPADGPPF